MNANKQWRREEVKAEGGYLENERKCEIFRKSEKILDEFSREFGEFQMDFLLIQRILGEFFLKFGGFLADFLSNLENILVVLSPEIGESCHQKAEGRYLPSPPLAPPLDVLHGYSDFQFTIFDILIKGEKADWNQINHSKSFQIN